MSGNDFRLHVKSTLDKIMNDLVTSIRVSTGYADLQGVEIDNLVQTDEVLKSDSPALLWQFGVLVADPRDPLYRLEFLVGCKTVLDAGNYVMAVLNNELGKAFEVGATIAIADYSGSTAGAQTGYMLVTGNVLSPQQYDNMSGIRFFSISACAARTA